MVGRFGPRAAIHQPLPYRVPSLPTWVRQAWGHGTPRGVCQGAHACADTHSQPTCAPLTHRRPFCVQSCGQLKKHRCQAGATRERPGWAPRELLFIQPVPPHLSLAGLFSLLHMGGEVPFEARQVWNPRGGRICDPGPCDLRSLTAAAPCKATTSLRIICHPHPTPCGWGRGLIHSPDFPPGPHSGTEV